MKNLNKNSNSSTGVSHTLHRDNRDSRDSRDALHVTRNNHLIIILLLCFSTLLLLPGCKKESSTKDGDDIGPIVSDETVVLSNNISENTTLKDLGLQVDYIIKGGSYKGSHLVVNNNATLIIEPGVTIMFADKESGITVKEGATIKAEGTSNNHIKFIGANNKKGAWDRINIESSTSNVLNYVEILNAGSQGYNYSAALTLYNGKVSISNSLIESSLTNGITLEQKNSELSVFENNIIKNCEKAPIYTYHSAGCYGLRKMDNNNTFSGNKNNYIHIWDDWSNNSTVNNMSLPHLNGFPWYFQSGLPVGTGAIQAIEFTIQPGAVLLMGENTALAVNKNSHLIAKGTAQKRIIIKGFGDNSGYWKGVQVESQTAGTILEYCDVINGGKRGDFEVRSGAIVLGTYSTYFEIYNSTVSKSATNGLVFWYSSETSNPGFSCYLKHSYVTFSGIGGYVFTIPFPDGLEYNALPIMNGNNWWRY